MLGLLENNAIVIGAIAALLTIATIVFKCGLSLFSAIQKWLTWKARTVRTANPKSSKVRNLTRSKFSIDELKAGLQNVIDEVEFNVFLCGPNLSNETCKEAAAIRASIQKELEKRNFNVHLGEDDGLTELQNLYHLSADQNELLFIENIAHCIILIASSAGSFCELGLFSHHFDQKLHANTDFILILDEAFKNERSYLNLGPSKSVDRKGHIFHADFSNFDISHVIERLENSRSTSAIGLSQ